MITIELKSITPTKAASTQSRWVLDFFAGSGTLGAAAEELGRKFFLIDKGPEAFEVMATRFSNGRESGRTELVSPDFEAASE